jgi:predicted nucleic acid-binding protein
MWPEPRWLLDTCVVSELSRMQPHENVVDWLRTNGPHCRLSTVTLGELVYGAHRLPPGARRDRLQSWVEELARQYAQRLLDTDRRVWMRFGQLKAAVEGRGRPRDDFDLLIAATALVHDLSVATRNRAHFDDIGVRLVDPWTSETA